jgi:ATP-dependent Clp protease ATP-binding subunit ClpA
MSVFSEYVRTTLEQAGREAQLDRATMIEAPHVLLAIAAQAELPAAQALSSVGLDRRALREALDRELEHSLNAAGVSRHTFDLPQPASAPTPATRLGASVKLALERGVAGIRKGRDLRPAHLLLGILLAEVGSVPRALRLAGIDRAELLVRVRQTLAVEREP